MPEIQVRENGELVLSNKNDTPINIWRIEFTYYSDTISQKLKERKEQRMRRVITESITEPFSLEKGEKKIIELKIPREIISEITVYYEEKGMYKKERLVLEKT